MGQIYNQNDRNQFIIFDEDFMRPLFGLLEQCRGVKQLDKYHPEGDVFTHSLQVMYKAFKESRDTDLILAAMLHDVGKSENRLGHEYIAVEWLKGYVSTKTLWLIKNHMRIWYLILGEMRKLSKVKYLIEHPWLPELILLARWDKMGRNINWKPKYNREYITNRLNKCANDHFVG